ncbi:VWA domain-containing protein [Streptomyces sp. NPDC018347]|uniref:VWA domain-containing protein n=1 Tax=Streptomyces sp. NPDC018347 TaxID=3157193 RepID=UPI003410B969
MGILTLLRNAFGRSRKTRATEAEGADRTQTPPTASPSLPEPRRAPAEEHTSAEHELVAAAFDNVQVPAPAPTESEPTTAEKEPEQTTEEKPKATAPTTTEPETDGKPETTAPTTAEPTAEGEPEEKPTAVTPPDAEPETEDKPEATAPATAEPTVEDESEATAPATNEPVTEEKPEATAPGQDVSAAEEKPTEADRTEAEPVTEEAAPPAEAAEPTAPQAADGEDAPQGPPAPDDETRTGGAGGNIDAEGEAEANTPTEAPQATRADGNTPAEGEAEANTPAEGEAETDAPAEGEAEADAPAGTPPTEKPKSATPLARLRSRTPHLVAAYKAAATTLRKTDLTGTRAKLYLVLDRSASMRPYYKDGSAQALADQTLALAAHLDPEATVHVVFFSTEVDGTTDLTLAPDHESKIDDVHAGLGRMGRTSYHAAVKAVLAHYDKHGATPDAPDTPRTPALVVFQTDGAPDAKTPATQALTDAAESHPGLFFSFVAFGDHDNKAFDYLRKLKTGNASFFHAGPAPRELTDAEVYAGVLATWRP